ncbi:hypothetical protein NITHO_4650004 [Nitrolancea hollandica Lb]|uniref:Uncharacterized protein n=1 Tax=Nitrolancea hollandica Lb TaxID=1129897 RepID=I4EKJ9_9BACT|nr:hypothetical protein NITHO_4650004 [Nitrolancea hollandica Lb]
MRVPAIGVDAFPGIPGRHSSHVTSRIGTRVIDHIHEKAYPKPLVWTSELPIRVRARVLHGWS